MFAEFGFWEEIIFRASAGAGIDHRKLNSEYTRLEVAKLFAVSQS